MGGGVGISMHGQYVVGGERITFAMPEVGIGFFPDVGGSYLLSRMPKGAGCYCAMTGSRLKQGDCAHYGLITHAIRLGPVRDHHRAPDRRREARDRS